MAAISNNAAPANPAGPTSLNAARARQWRQKYTQAVAEPVAIADVGRDDGSLELKLTFMSSLLPHRLVSFLDEWGAATAGWRSLRRTI